ncbi:MAG: SAM-dependent methyltransferase [Lachnospiraceae bacterium]|nr:SAM-dependent methyltransferase [Lachnospiraceae bacterium]
MGDKQIWLIGCGCGNSRYLTRQAAAAIRASELLIASSAMLHEIGADHVTIANAAETAGEVRHLIETTAKEKISVLVPWNLSEPYGQEILAALRDFHLQVIPGMAPLDYLAAKTGINTEDTLLCRNGDLPDDAEEVFTGRAFFLREPEKQEELKELLQLAGHEEAVCVWNPGRETERIFHGTAAELAKEEQFGKDSYVWVRFPEKKNLLRSGIFSGEEETTGILSVPKEIRAAVLRDLQIEKGDVIYDIGCGTGELSEEMAYLTGAEGRVFAIERSQETVETAMLRAEKTELPQKQLRFICGAVPAALAHIPAPDKAVLQGTDGTIKDLLQILISRNPAVRVTAVRRTVEGASEAVRLMDGMHFSPEMLQISMTRTLKKDGRHRLIGEPPYYLITGTHRAD